MALALKEMVAGRLAMEEALQALHQWPVRTFFTCHIMMYAFSRCHAMIAHQRGHCQESMAMKPSLPMHQQGRITDKHILMTMLKSCANSRNIQKGMHVHAHIIEAGISLDGFLGNSLLSMYAKCGCLDDAARLLEMIPERNTVSWTVIITCYAKHGLDEQALALYRQMELEDVKPNEVTVVCVINSCTCRKALKDGKTIHTTVCKHGLESDIVIASSLVNMYAKHGYLMDAQRVFDKMLDRNVVTWTSMIAGYSDHGSAEEAMDLYQQMQHEGAKPDQVTFMSILKACTSLGALDMGKQYHAIIINADSKHTISLDNALINMYAKCGRLETSSQILQRMEKRDVASWSMMIAGCIESGQAEIALDYFKQMQDEIVKPNNVTFIGILKACANLALLKEGQIIHDSIVKGDFWADRFVVSALIDMYTKCGRIGDACQVFDSSDKKDVVSWTAMITGCARQGCNEEALEFFERMQISGMKANEVTFVSVLRACACLVALKKGTQIHEQICKSGLDSSVEVGTALVDMYAKCGRLEDAHCVLNRIPACGVVTWTAMVIAYAQHACGKEALELVNQMQQKEMKLDHVSFIAILAACNNSGLVNEASCFFELMCKDYGLVPSTKHYACMVDAFSRAGQIEEAENLVKRMPLQPNAVSWRALLGACKNHDSLKLADHVAEQLLNFESQDAGDFVLLSNVYGAAAARDDKEGAVLSHESTWDHVT